MVKQKINKKSFLLLLPLLIFFNLSLLSMNQKLVDDPLLNLLILAALLCVCYTCSFLFGWTITDNVKESTDIQHTELNKKSLCKDFVKQ